MKLKDIFGFIMIALFTWSFFYMCLEDGITITLVTIILGAIASGLVSCAFEK